MSFVYFGRVNSEIFYVKKHTIIQSENKLHINLITVTYPRLGITNEITHSTIGSQRNSRFRRNSSKHFTTFTTFGSF